MQEASLCICILFVFLSVFVLLFVFVSPCNLHREEKRHLCLGWCKRLRRTAAFPPLPPSPLCFQKRLKSPLCSQIRLSKKERKKSPLCSEIRLSKKEKKDKIWIFWTKIMANIFSPVFPDRRCDEINCYKTSPTKDQALHIKKYQHWKSNWLHCNTTTKCCNRNNRKHNKNDKTTGTAGTRG